MVAWWRPRSHLGGRVTRIRVVVPLLMAATLVAGSAIAADAAVNAAPVLDASKTPPLPTVAEDPGAPSGAVGTPVSGLVDTMPPAGGLDNVSDPDGPGAGLALAAID